MLTLLPWIACAWALEVGQMRVVVVEDTLELPIPDVELEVRGPEDRDARTNAAGEQLFAEMTPGTYTLRVRQHGYLPITVEDIQVTAWRTAARQLVMTEDPVVVETRAATLTSDQAAVVPAHPSGGRHQLRVVGRHGAPLPIAEVHVLDARDGTLLDRTTTRSDGRAQLRVPRSARCDVYVDGIRERAGWRGSGDLELIVRRATWRPDRIPVDLVVVLADPTRSWGSVEPHVDRLSAAPDLDLQVTVLSHAGPGGDLGALIDQAIATPFRSEPRAVRTVIVVAADAPLRVSEDSVRDAHVRGVSVDVLADRRSRQVVRLTRDTGGTLVATDDPGQFVFDRIRAEVAGYGR